jgi:hypothetical protein
MKKRLFFCLRFAVSIVLIVLLLSSVDTDRFFRPITPSSWLYIGLTALVANLDRVLMSYKWDILLKAKGIVLPFTELLRSYYIGTFWGFFLPVSVGGDVVRACRISGTTNRVGEIVSSVVVERVLGIMPTFVMGILSGTVFAAYITPDSWEIAVSIGAAFFLFVGLVFLSFNRHLAEWLESRFVLGKHSLNKKLREVYQSYQAYQHHHGPIVRFLLWSLVEQCMPILCAFLMSNALSLNVPFWSFFIFIPLILLLLRIPVSLGGFGVNEGLYVYFFSFVGLSVSDAFLLGFLMHIVGLVSLLPVFFYYSFSLPSPATVQSDLPG